MYKKMYLILFKAITDALTAIKAQNFGMAADILIRAQQDAEETYLSTPEK